MKKQSLLEERERLYAKRSELEKEFDRLLKQAYAQNISFSREESSEYHRINYQRMQVREKINEISETLKMYEVVEDCLETFLERLKAEYDIKPKTITTSGMELLDEANKREKQG